MPNGSEMVGYADLVIMTDDGFALVDHKCLNSSAEEATKTAAGFGGQLGAYARTITAATGKKCFGCFLHAVLQGLIVAVSVEGE